MISSVGVQYRPNAPAAVSVTIECAHVDFVDNDAETTA